MAQNNRQKGNIGENMAVAFLEEKGYNIIQRNFYKKSGEIDIIAENDSFLIFAEVKYRKNLKKGYPREAVDFRKQEKIRNTALLFMAELGRIEKAIRFDVIEIIDDKIEHIENAF